MIKIAKVKNENSKSEFLHFLGIFFKCFTKRNKAKIYGAVVVPNLHAKNGIYKVCCVWLWLCGVVGSRAVVRGLVVVVHGEKRRKRPNLPPKSPTNAYIMHLSTFPMIFMLVSSPASMR